MEMISYKLDGFEGPLDLLLYLISKNKLNIYDINISALVDQYTDHIRAMQSSDMEVASEFLSMAARLVYLKTVSLLPKHEEAEVLKKELTGELLEYQTCRLMAAKFAGMTDGFASFIRRPEPVKADKTYRRKHPASDLLSGYLAAVGRGQRKQPPSTTVFAKIVARKIVSVSSKIVGVLRNLRRGQKKRFQTMFEHAESRSELVATFLAVLELIKARRVEVTGEGDATEIALVTEQKRRGVSTAELDS